MNSMAGITGMNKIYISLTNDINNYNYTILEFIKKNTSPDNIKNGDSNIVLINNHYIAHYNDKLNNIINKLQCKYISIEFMPTLKGGGIVDIFKSILEIGKVFMFLIDLILWFVKFIIWLVQFLIWFFKFLLIDLTMDFTNSMLLILVTIFKLPFDLIGSMMAFITNTIGGWMTTFWGWDESNLTKNDKNSNYFRGIDRGKGRKCFLTNTNKVPFSILLCCILCPPLSVWMTLGFTGWFPILISCILTMCFYLPGLLYSLLVIYA